MEQRTKLLIGAGVVILLLLIVTAVFFISKAAKPAANNALNNLNTVHDDSTTVNVTPTPVQTGNSTTKTYIGQGFALRYPSSWGLLTCSNSSNFELDPTNSVDQKGVACNVAVKPITVLVSDNRGSCQAGKKTWSDGQTDYRWCVNIGKVYLDITHRVSAQGFTATSTTDYSSAVDEMIRTLSTTPQGS